MRTGALEVVGAQATAPGTTTTVVTFNSGNSALIRNCPRGAYLLDVWLQTQGTSPIGIIRSPRMHDNVNGIRLRASAANPVPVRSGVPQSLVSQDTLTVEMQGSATAGDIEIIGYNIYYPDLPGSNATLLTPRELALYSTGLEMVTENTLATGTAGGWSGSEAINAETDQFKANRYYALIGYDVQLASGTWPGSIQYTGPDMGNLGVGGPGGATFKIDTRQYFIDLSLKYGITGIPVINSANKNATTIACHIDENGADPIVSTRWLLLDEAFNPNLLQPLA